VNITTRSSAEQRSVLTGEVRHTARFAQRDDAGRIAGTRDVSWTAIEGYVPIAVAAEIVEEAVQGAAPQIEAAASEAIDRWLARNAAALPEVAAPDQLATDYWREVKAALLDGRIDAEVFVLPRSFIDRNEGTK
jgi:hypothetical protein